MTLIDKEALLEKLGQFHPDYMFNIASIKNFIKEEPEVEKGKWVSAKDGIDGHVKCNQCFKTYDYDSEAQYYNFCPNCGADMREEQDG